MQFYQGALRNLLCKGKLRPRASGLGEFWLDGYFEALRESFRVLGLEELRALMVEGVYGAALFGCLRLAGGGFDADHPKRGLGFRGGPGFRDLGFLGGQG